MDLGSGDGRQVLLASVLHSYTKLIGLELVPALHSLAVKSLSCMDLHVQRFNNQVITFESSDLLKSDWISHQPDIILVNWTCFPLDFRNQIMDISNGLKVGTLAIVVTHLIVHSDWTFRESKKRSMSWGVGTYHIFEKLGPRR